jgi:hypothetical protein
MRKPEQWQWSSCRDRSGLEKTVPLLDLDAFHRYIDQHTYNRVLET